VLLLDEPLGALDAKLRRALQIELKALQESVGITFIYVTHDQEEALTMSDRLAVMAHGRVAQIGPPQDVYEEPVDAYVADFLGVSNLMGAELMHSGQSGRCVIRIGEFDLEAVQASLVPAGTVRVAIRPERVRLEEFGMTGPNRVPGMVERLVFLGSATQVFVRLAPGASLQALMHNHGEPLAWSQGTPVSVFLPSDAIRVLPEGIAPATDSDVSILADSRRKVAKQSKASATSP
jgi:spermidine/putrescine transport system ATP-binding protein